MAVKERLFLLTGSAQGIYIYTYSVKKTTTGWWCRIGGTSKMASWTGLAYFALGEAPRRCQAFDARILLFFFVFNPAPFASG